MISKLFSFLIVALIIFNVGCNNAGDSAQQKDSVIIKEQTVVDPAYEAALNASLLKQFNSIEKVFDNQNWMMVSGKDTSYLYVSRLSKFFAQVHNFQMQKGDSANLIVDTIMVDGAHKIAWNWKGKKYILTSSTDYTNNWQSDSSKISFKKNDIGTLILEKNASDKITLKKTLPLSTFLIRSFYDYQHGTKMAFDETDYTQKKQ